jgi:hypothetical protein
MTYLDELVRSIEHNHGCEAHFDRFEPVAETYLGEIVWQGDVGVFDLVDHPKARRCYAWGFPPDDEATKRQITTVLEIPPVVSAETAVKAAIISKRGE